MGLERHVEIGAGRHRLSGVIHYPTAEALTALAGRSPGLIMVHGFMGDKVGKHRFFVKGARRLAKKGFTVLRFDFSGCGDSSGDHQDITIDTQVTEVRAAIDWLQDQPIVDGERIGLIGMSLGGCVAALAAARDERVGKLVLWAPVARPLNDIVAIVGDKVYEAAFDHGVADYQGYELGEGFFHSLANADPLREAPRFGGEALILHGAGDEDVSSANLEAYRERLAKSSGKYIEGADHVFSSLKWEEELFRETEEWLKAQGWGV